MSQSTFQSNNNSTFQRDAPRARSSHRNNVHHGRPANNGTFNINENTRYNLVIPRLTAIGNIFIDNASPLPVQQGYFKPATQLTHIKEYMEIIAPQYFNEYIGALQYVDAGWRIVHVETRNYESRKSNIIDIRLFNQLMITYSPTAFGRAPTTPTGAPMWSQFYESICSMSNFRHSCKKAHKMIFTYYIALAALERFPNLKETCPLVSYTIGAVQYAIHVKDHLEAIGAHTAMIYFGYILTLATFFNGWRHRPIDDHIPKGFVFEQPRRYQCLDTFTKVNDSIVAKFLNSDMSTPIEGMFPEDGYKGLVEDHLYTFPQCCAQNIQRTPDIRFHDPHDIRTDMVATKAFVEFITKVKPLATNFNVVKTYSALEHLDEFESQFIVSKYTPINTTPNTFYNNFDEAIQAINSTHIPDSVKNDNLWFTVSIVTGQDQNGSIFELFLLHQNGTVYNSVGNLVRQPKQ